MTYTKRQWFIYRLGQCVNLLGKVSNYMLDVKDYAKDSKFERQFNKLDKLILKSWSKADELLEKVQK